MIELNNIFIGIIIFVIIFFIFILFTSPTENKLDNQNSVVKNPISNIPPVSIQNASIQPSVIHKNSLTYEKSIDNITNNLQELNKIITNSVDSITNIISSQSIPTIIFED
jgi:hypothetical protein